jgi:hypothetical protein
MINHYNTLRRDGGKNLRDAGNNLRLTGMESPPPCMVRGKSTTIFARRNAFSGSWFPVHPGIPCIHSDAGFE